MAMAAALDNIQVPRKAVVMQTDVSQAAAVACRLAGAG